MRPKVPAEEGFNQNISQTEDLPTSTLTTRKQELIREPTAETRHLKVAGEPHKEQDRTWEAKCPEDQAVEKDVKQYGTCSGAESEEAEGGW